MPVNYSEHDMEGARRSGRLEGYDAALNAFKRAAFEESEARLNELTYGVRELIRKEKAAQNGPRIDLKPDDISAPFVAPSGQHVSPIPVETSPPPPAPQTRPS